jgi:tRNA(fMet)-specific endonuclease VapC
MITHLLDTDTCIAVLRQRERAVTRISELPSQSCAVSSITVFELLSGVRKARNPDREKTKMETLLAMVATLAFDETTAHASAQIRMDLESKGTPIGAYDLLIAGQAIAAGLILVTGNNAEFRRVPGLRIESWM